MGDESGPRGAVSRREFLKAAGLGLGALAGAGLACGRGGGGAEGTAAGPTPTSAPPATATSVQAATQPPPEMATDTPAPAAGRRIITRNDYVPEQRNVVDTVVVLVNFAGRPERVFDLGAHWDKIFGQEDPIGQLNAYYRENFYGQLELRPFSAPEMGSERYITVELPGLPQDYSFGWLVGLETEEIAAVDPDAAQRLILAVMARVVEKHPGLDYQDKFLLVVLNATGTEYGRGAAGVVPTGGVEPLYDLFIGDVTADEAARFSDDQHFRMVGGKLVGAIGKSGYTFADYFRDRESRQAEDQFILGMALFSTDAPLSCASHDILHGLRRKSAYADPPEGRERAVNCLYNLQLQSQWLVGTPEHGRCDRSINCSPYIGWWDPMGDHLHPTLPRDFFASHPHGMSAFTKLRMGFIPDRCLAVVEEDDVTLALAPLSSPQLPAPGSEAEALVVKVPLVPGHEPLAHIYLLLEYRCRVGAEGERHPDHFTIAPDYVLGDKRYDPGYNAADPARSRYVNPPTTFVSKEGVLVYLVNEGMPEIPGLPYTGWQNFVLALLNPAGNDQRQDLTQAALDTGERIEVDFRTIYPDRGIPLLITVTVAERTTERARVRVQRQRLG